MRQSDSGVRLALSGATSKLMRLESQVVQSAIGLQFAKDHSQKLSRFSQVTSAIAVP